MRAKRLGGFTLIELLIVVAIIGIIAAIALPVLARARVSANESGTIGDIRTVLGSEAVYYTANGAAYDGNLACLASPATCIPGYPANGPTFLDSMVASRLPKLGYVRSFSPGPPALNQDPAIHSPTSVSAYVYTATPVQVGLTGVRGFAGDATGVLCLSIDGAAPPYDAQFRLITASPDCRALK